MRGCAREPQREIDGHRSGTDLTADPVGAEITSRHWSELSHRLPHLATSSMLRRSVLTGGPTERRRVALVVGKPLHDLAGF